MANLSNFSNLLIVFALLVIFLIVLANTLPQHAFSLVMDLGELKMVL